jgi:hypothetical protein
MPGDGSGLPLEVLEEVVGFAFKGIHVGRGGAFFTDTDTEA